MTEGQNSEVERLRSVVAELTSLNEIAGNISASMSVENITETMIDRSLKHIGASQGAVFLLSRERSSSDQLKTFIRRTTGTQREMPIHLNMNLTGWMIKHKELLVINSPATENPFTRLDLESLGINSLLAAPLLTRNGLIGVMAIFNKEGDQGFTSQDCHFLQILGSQCSQVIEAARLYDEEKRLMILREELEVARSIQQSLLPVPTEVGDETIIFGFNSPAREVGGDFYDMVLLDDDTIFLSVGDVVGKGVPAALLMSNALAVERSHLSNQQAFSVAAMVTNLNQLIFQFTKPGQFITAYFGILDRRRGCFEYVNAGHPPPVIVNDGQLVPCDHHADVVLGVLDGFQYQSATLQLPPDSTICIFSDGVTEAFNEAGEEYGERRLISYIRKSGSESARAICDGLLDELKQFRGDAEQSDDITAVVIKTNPES